MAAYGWCVSNLACDSKTDKRLTCMIDGQNKIRKLRKKQRLTSGIGDGGGAELTDEDTEGNQELETFTRLEIHRGRGRLERENINMYKKQSLVQSISDA